MLVDPGWMNEVYAVAYMIADMMRGTKASLVGDSSNKGR